MTDDEDDDNVSKMSHRHTLNTRKETMSTEERLNDEFEAAVVELYRVLINFRENKLYKEEYNNVSTLTSMLLQDKLHLYTKYKDQID